MKGRLEKEIYAEQQIFDKLKNIPTIFQEYYYTLKSEGKSYTTINNYICHNIDFMNYLSNGKLHEHFYVNVTATNINNYIVSIRKKVIDGHTVIVGDDIRAARWSSINSFFTFLKNNNYIRENPVDKTRRPKIKTEHKVTFLSAQEISDVIEKIKQNATDKKRNRDLCIVSMALSTGLKVGAITQINIEDIDLFNNTINVIEKGGKIRVVRFGNNLNQLICNYIDDRNRYYPNAQTNALFLSQCQRRMTTQAVRDLVSKYTKDTFKRHITPSELRTSAAVNLVNAGVNLKTISNIMGNENIQATKNYIEVSDGEEKHAIKFLDDLI